MTVTTSELSCQYPGEKAKEPNPVGVLCIVFYPLLQSPEVCGDYYCYYYYYYNVLLHRPVTAYARLVQIIYIQWLTDLLTYRFFDS